MRGSPADAVASRFRYWLDGCPVGIRSTAFNRRFDFHPLLLGGPPWNLQTEVPAAGCIMELGLEILAPFCDREAGTGPLKWLAPRERYAGEQGQWKWPKASEAATWLRSRGHSIPELRSHRALDDARTEAAILVANEAIQMHGGIGMTDEHEIGFYLKRARVAEMTFGDAAFHRDRWARLSGY